MVRSNGVSGRGNLVGVTFADITDRKHAERELRLTQFSVDQASDAVHWLDSRGRIVYVNEAACQSLQRTREELLSRPLPISIRSSHKIVWEESWRG